MVYAGHISQDRQRIQPIKAHLEQTAKKAEEFADDFGFGKFAALCGLLHDIGKYSDKFQRRIYEGGNPTDHSTAGAKEIAKRYGRIGKLLAYCIAGHHAGLPDGGSAADTEDTPTLFARLFQKSVEPYGHFARDILLPQAIPDAPQATSSFSLSFFIRMVFSCLVDADFLDTEAFMQGEGRKPVYEDMNTLNAKIDTKIKQLNEKTKSAEKSAFPTQNDRLNVRRSEILRSCLVGAEGKPGLYTLTVPTGGGKTLSSLAFAIKHAQKHNMKRIIYVIPFNSIIEQNAKVFEDVLGEWNVLQHHSGIDYNDSEGDILSYKRLATENWDMPVVVSTAVQFFESLFANKSSKCRKLHNIANSVIILDEAQLLPLEYLLPCTRAIEELVTSYRCTAVLCSATQPALNRFFKQLESRELYGQAREAYPAFTRAALKFVGEIDDETLVQRLKAERQALCVVSTRNQAQNVFEKIKGEGVYHLSTYMVPAHRRAVLTEIRQRLTNGLPCRVVSTSLIEAGVDVDFPVVYRAEAGLDSLIQAAGRCNREGRQPEICPVYVFKPEARYKLPAMLQRPIEVMRAIARACQDAMSPEAIEMYFNELYDVQGDGVDKMNIVNRLCKSKESIPFAEIARDFRLIGENTCPIVIPYDGKAKELMKRLKDGKPSRELLRSLQPYMVNVYPRSYDALKKGGWLDALEKKTGEGLAVLTDMSKYDDDTGLNVQQDEMQLLYI